MTSTATVPEIYPPGYLIDFRDTITLDSTIDCAVCGRPADGWDRHGGFIFHTNAKRHGIPPCRVQ